MDLRIIEELLTNSTQVSNSNNNNNNNNNDDDDDDDDHSVFTVTCRVFEWNSYCCYNEV